MTDEHRERVRRRRGTRAEVAQRVHQVLAMRLRGAQMHDLRAMARRLEWGVSDAAIARYVIAANKIMRKCVELEHESLIEFHLTARRTIYARCYQMGDMRGALSALRDEARLVGLYPQQHQQREHRRDARVDQSTTIDVTIKSELDDERLAEIADILRAAGVLQACAPARAAYSAHDEVHHAHATPETGGIPPARLP